MRSSPPIRLSLLLLTIIALADVAVHAGTALAVTGWASQIVVVTGLLVLAGIFTVVWPVRPVADIAFYIALWWSFAAFASIATYLAAAHATGLVDELLLSIDRALGFDWPAWESFVHAHPWLTMVLHSAYMTLPLQILGSIVYFSIVTPARNERFFLACALALVVTTIASAVFPAAGPFIDYGNTQNDTLYFTQVLSVRTGAPLRFDLGDLQGIICFPSYHTILAIIFVMSHAGLRWSFYPVLALNAVMLVSIPSEGGHYLVDMLGGLPVALGSMAAAKWASAHWHPRDLISAASVLATDPTTAAPCRAAQG